MLYFKCIHSIEGIPVIIRFKTTSWSWIECIQYLCIEGIPVIIRFKTRNQLSLAHVPQRQSIEGIPVIIRFKTPGTAWEQVENNSIEGIPVIIRFKT